MRITAVKPRNKGSVVKLEDPELEVWCSADLETVQSWAGTVPDTFELKTKRDSSEQILVEKRGGGQTAYRNTKEAFEAEAASRRAWQEIEEDRKDRRTAAMTALEARGDESSWHQLAEEIYQWLRRDSSGGREAIRDKTEAPRRDEAGRRDADLGEGSRSSGSAPLECTHRWENGGEARVTIRGTEVCGRCRQPWISITEGTEADLGAAWRRG